VSAAAAYQQALDYIYAFMDYENSHSPRSSENYDLRRMDELLSRLGNPHLKVAAVHVAGTKGKGSTSAMIASSLTACGYRTGLYTSPHLIDLRERMRIGNVLISRLALVRLVNRLKPEIEAVNARAVFGRLTTFEVLTTLGFAWFAQEGVDFQVVEVGLGGRLDATNVVCPQVSVITTIGLDHTEVLGNTLPQIAAEKAGIIKPGVPVVCAWQTPDVDGVIAAACQRACSPLIRVGREINWQGERPIGSRQAATISGRLNEYRVSLPLLGDYQIANAAAAVGVLEVLQEKGFNIGVSGIVRGLEKVRWPGRFQIIGRRPLIIADGAHNPAAALELSRALAAYSVGRGHRLLVIGTSYDKDFAGMARELAPLFDTVIATRSRHPRSLTPDKLATEFECLGLKVLSADSVTAALNQAVMLSGEQGLICVTGSLFVAGEALAWAHRRAY
jgi:dihydrofolate synthase/folylpolyglutamate synthase